MNHLTIRGRLMATGTVAFACLLLLAGINLYSKARSEAALSGIYENSVRPLLMAQQMESDLKEVRFRIAGVILDQMPSVGSLNHLNEVRGRLPQQWAEVLRRSNAGTVNPDTAALLQRIDQGIGALPPFFDKVGAAYRADDRKVLNALLEEDWPRVQSTVLKPLGQLLPLQAAQVQHTYEVTQATGTRLSGLVLVSLVFSSLLLFVALGLTTVSIARGVDELKGVLGRLAGGDFTVRSNTTRRDEFGAMGASLNASVAQIGKTVQGVKAAAERLGDAAEELRRQTLTVAQATHAQAASVADANQDVGQISASANAIAEGSVKVAHASGRSMQLATGSHAQTESSILATRRVEARVNDSAVMIEALEDATDSIEGLSGTIREIAEQTNLLALNAAIEAARAGEQGRGFAVVADEVRKLAERTATSTSNISTTVAEIRTKTNAAVKAMRQVRDEVQQGVTATLEVGQSLTHILEGSSVMTQLAEDIAAATRDQSRVTGETAQRMNKMLNQFAESEMALARFTAISNDTASTAEALKGLVNQFKA